MAQFIPLDKLPLQYSLSILQVIVPCRSSSPCHLYWSAILHLSLIIVRGNNHGYKTTFRAVPILTADISLESSPLLGSLSKHLCFHPEHHRRERGHEISTGKAILAVLLPLMVIFGLTIIAIFTVVMFIGSMGFLGGVRI